MTTTAKELSKILLAGLALGFAACDEPVDGPPNPNATPVVSLTVFRDSVAYQGYSAGATETAVVNSDGTFAGTNLDVGTAASLSPVGSIGLLQTSVAYVCGPPPSFNGTQVCTDPNPTYTLTGNPNTITLPTTVFPFNQPQLQFNKELNGDTIEATARDPQTGRQLGECNMAGAPLSLTYTPVGGTGASTVPNLVACFSPSDRLVTAEPALPNPTPAVVPTGVLFLNYSSNYTLATSPAIKDKSGNSLTPFTLNFQTGPFEFLFLTDVGNQTMLWAAPDTHVELDTTGDANTVTLPASTVAAPTQVVGLMFSGPVWPATVGQDGKTAVNPNSDTDAIDPTGTLNNPTPGVGPVLLDSNHNPLVVSGHSAQFVVTPPGGSSTFSSDPRFLYLVHPALINDQTSTDGFTCPSSNKTPCPYYIELPKQFTDNGTVTKSPSGAQVQTPITFPSGATLGPNGAMEITLWIAPLPAP